MSTTATREQSLGVIPDTQDAEPVNSPQPLLASEIQQALLNLPATIRIQKLSAPGGIISEADIPQSSINSLVTLITRDLVVPPQTNETPPTKTKADINAEENLRNNNLEVFNTNLINVIRMIFSYSQNERVGQQSSEQDSFDLNSQKLVVKLLLKKLFSTSEGALRVSTGLVCQLQMVESEFNRLKKLDRDQSLVEALELEHAPNTRLIKLLLEISLELRTDTKREKSEERKREQTQTLQSHLFENEPAQEDQAPTTEDAEQTKKPTNRWRKILKRFFYGTAAIATVAAPLAVAATHNIHESGGLKPALKNALSDIEKQFYPQDGQTSAFVDLFFHRVEHQLPYTIDDLTAVLSTTDETARHEQIKKKTQEWQEIDNRNIIIDGSLAALRKERADEAREKAKNEQIQAKQAFTLEKIGPDTEDIPQFERIPVVADLKMGNCGSPNARTSSEWKEITTTAYALKPVLDEIYQKYPNLNDQQKAEVEFIAYQLKTITLLTIDKKGIITGGGDGRQDQRVDTSYVKLLNAFANLPHDKASSDQAIAQVIGFILGKETLQSLPQTPTANLSLLIAIASNPSINTGSRLEYIATFLLQADLEENYPFIELQKLETTTDSHKNNTGAGATNIELVKEAIDQSDVGKLKPWQVALLMTSTDQKHLEAVQQFNLFLVQHPEYQLFFDDLSQPSQKQDYYDYLYTKLRPIVNLFSGDAILADPHFQTLQQLLMFYESNTDLAKSANMIDDYQSILDAISSHPLNSTNETKVIADLFVFAKENGISINTTVLFALGDFFPDQQLNFAEKMQLFDRLLGTIKNNANTEKIITYAYYGLHSNLRQQFLELVLFLDEKYQHKLAESDPYNISNGLIKLLTTSPQMGFHKKGEAVIQPTNEQIMDLFSQTESGEDSLLDQVLTGDERNLDWTRLPGNELYHQIEEKYGLSPMTIENYIVIGIQAMAVDRNINNDWIKLLECLNGKPEDSKNKYLTILQAVVQLWPKTAPLPNVEQISTIYDLTQKYGSSFVAVQLYFDLYKDNKLNQELQDNLDELEKRGYTENLITAFRSIQSSSNFSIDQIIGFDQLAQQFLELPEDKTAANEILAILNTVAGGLSDPSREHATNIINEAKYYLALLKAVKAHMPQSELDLVESQLDEPGASPEQLATNRRLIDRHIISFIWETQNGIYGSAEQLAIRLPEQFTPIMVGGEAVAAVSHKALDPSTITFSASRYNEEISHHAEDTGAKTKDLAFFSRVVFWGDGDKPFVVENQKANIDYQKMSDTDFWNYFGGRDIATVTKDNQVKIERIQLPTESDQQKTEREKLQNVFLSSRLAWCFNTVGRDGAFITGTKPIDYAESFYRVVLVAYPRSDTTSGSQYLDLVPVFINAYTSTKDAIEEAVKKGLIPAHWTEIMVHDNGTTAVITDKLQQKSEDTGFPDGLKTEMMAVIK